VTKGGGKIRSITGLMQCYGFSEYNGATEYNDLKLYPSWIFLILNNGDQNKIRHYQDDPICDFETNPLLLRHSR
jgi:hypothetical protein